MDEVPKSRKGCIQYFHINSRLTCTNRYYKVFHKEYIVENNMKRNLILLFAISLITVYALACATRPPVQRDIDTGRIVDKSYDEVWEGVIDFFASNNINIQTIEKDSGIIVSEPMKVPHLGVIKGMVIYNGIEICDCGEPGLNQLTYFYMKFNVFVKRIDEDTTSIKVNAQFPGTYYNALLKVAGTWDCASTGNMEQLIIDSILKDK